MRTRTLIGWLLILLGIGLCVGLLTFQYLHCAELWSSTHKELEFASTFDYFLSVSTGAIVLSVAVGGVLTVWGILLLPRRHRRPLKDELQHL